MGWQFLHEGLRIETVLTDQNGETRLKEGTASPAASPATRRIRRKQLAQLKNHFGSGCPALVSIFLRIRRNSMKLRAVIAHSTDPNEIIKIVSIERGLLPRLPLHQAPATADTLYKSTLGVPRGRCRGKKISA
jgi:hypothetical protein